MPFPILGGKSIVSEAYTVGNSCRFNGTDDSLTYTPGSTGNVDKWTLSLWLKKGWQKAASFHTLSQGLFMAGSGGDYTMIRFQSSGATYPDSILFENYFSNVLKGQTKTLVGWRDISAWYHFVFVWDSGNATGGDRMRTYANGKEVTVFGSDINPDADQDSHVCSTVEHNFGNFGSEPFHGYLAEVALCDGQTYDADDFGEFDSNSPTIWKPKDISGLTFGTTGFYLDFADSGNLGDDESGNTNDFTENNIAAVDQSVDTPTNNACTLNSLAVATSNINTFSEGNCKMVRGSSVWRPAYGTFPVSSGKWYYEVKGMAFPGTSYIQIGWVSLEYTANGNAALVDEVQGWGNLDPAVIYDSRAGNVRYQAPPDVSSSTSYGSSFTAGDVIGVALDLDNNNIYFAEDNTWSNSGDPESGATGKGAFNIITGYTWVPFIGLNNATAEVTFASPVQANSSDANDANGYGVFEFAPPSGYLAVCSKNMVD